jgi:hypothetical protein
MPVPLVYVSWRPVKIGSFFLTADATQAIFVGLTFLSKILIVTYCSGFGVVTSIYAQQSPDQPSRIERLGTPKAAPPPGSNSEDLESQAEEDLRRKQIQREEREDGLLPPEPPYSLQRKKNLLKEALIPHDRSLLIELAFYLTTASVIDDRSQYVSDPAVHFNLFYRHDAKNRNDKIGPWIGFRLVPFTGSGFHQNRFGTYGLTYFGPMIGVGKIGLMPTKELGAVRSNESIEPKIPTTSGWLLGGGFAAVTKSGKTTDDNPAPDSDFRTRGATFDASGFWIEGRYLKILYGAVGYNLTIGVQTGRGKAFVYAGVGAAGWD